MDLGSSGFDESYMWWDQNRPKFVVERVTIEKSRRKRQDETDARAISMSPFVVGRADMLCTHRSNNSADLLPLAERVRQLLWHRHQLVQMRTRIMNQIAGVGHERGLSLGEKTIQRTRAAQLESLR